MRLLHCNDVANAGKQTISSTMAMPNSRRTLLAGIWGSLFDKCCSPLPLPRVPAAPAYVLQLGHCDWASIPYTSACVFLLSGQHVAAAVGFDSRLVLHRSGSYGQHQRHQDAPGQSGKSAETRALFIGCNAACPAQRMWLQWPRPRTGLRKGNFKVGKIAREQDSVGSRWPPGLTESANANMFRGQHNMSGSKIQNQWRCKVSVAPCSAVSRQTTKFYVRTMRWQPESYQVRGCPWSCPKSTLLAPSQRFSKQVCHKCGKRKPISAQVRSEKRRGERGREREGEKTCVAGMHKDLFRHPTHSTSHSCEQMRTWLATT